MRIVVSDEEVATKRKVTRLQSSLRVVGSSSVVCRAIEQPGLRQIAARYQSVVSCEVSPVKVYLLNGGKRSDTARHVGEDVNTTM